MIKATIIADSVSAHTNQRITTFELEYPRFILAELNTHRAFSRNSASSRAIPIDTMLNQVALNPAMPVHWGLNKSGMQAKDEQADRDACEEAWHDARDAAMFHACKLQLLGLHKQIVNRVLEPFQMMKTLVTATNFDNFFNLRCHKDAQPEIKELADKMYQAMQKSTPMTLKAGEWHLPYIITRKDRKDNIYYLTDDLKTFLDLDTAIKISCSCAAQVSYRKNDTSIEKALAIYDKLVGSEPVHASSFEHCAMPMKPHQTRDGITHVSSCGTHHYSGNFLEWVQYRHLIKGNTCHNYTPN